MSVCGRVAFRRLLPRDNGEAGAGGQPPRRLFPRLLRGLCGADRAQAAVAQGSAFRQRLDLPVEFLERRLAHDRLAIDEKGRGSPDLERLDGELAARSDQTGRDSPVSERRRVA